MAEEQINDQEALGYEHTLMFGHYKKNLEEYARAEAFRIKHVQKLLRKEEKLIERELKQYKSKWQRICKGYFSSFWQHTFAHLGEDWIFLTLLGVICSILSFTMDYGISICQKARMWLYRDLTQHPILQYLAWIAFPMTLILFASGFVHLAAPQAIGSGIPEMKTILRGVVLKEYLTLRTLVSKMVGLTCTLASGLPLGKEGPFVHIASIVATMLSKLITSFKGIYENSSRQIFASAMALQSLAMSCATQIFGVLFSIEVTSVFFAVRNYWRGFFAACCGAMIWRLLDVWLKEEETIIALYKTNFQTDFPFDPQELIAFALVGISCGLAGAAFVWLHRKIVLFVRSRKKLNRFLQKNRLLYPTLITLFISSLTFPLGLGQFMAAELSTQEAVRELFSNMTWKDHTVDGNVAFIVSHWTTQYTSFYVNLVIFILVTFLTTAIAATLPVPSGVFIPVFKMGAAFGRLIGEGMVILFPEGLHMAGTQNNIIPGGYAVAGAAAFSGSVTHTISTSVIVFELTGQMSHILPVIISVLVSNAVAHSLQPSIYDSIIKMKNLPYLPPVVSASSDIHNVYVDDIMVRDIIYIWKGATFRDLKKLLRSSRLEVFPLVESPESMILLGSVHRVELLWLYEMHFGRQRRLQEVAKRQPLDDSLRKSPREQRQSRFEVIPVPANGRRSPRVSPPPSPTMTPKSPRKSILKHSPVNSPYNTITSLDARLRQAFDAVFRKTLTLQDVNSGDKSDSSAPTTPTLPKRVQLPKERVIDMSPEEQLAWEEDQMNSIIDFSQCHIDPAPFQLVKRTSLIKVHAIFSMLGLNHAYVTSIGCLIGVVALKEVRQAIENIPVRSSTRAQNSVTSEGTTKSSSQPPSEAQSEIDIIEAIGNAKEVVDNQTSSLK
ncbi:chloride channel protein 2-like [Centruroides sculpturatus]|uniref:chloride channel protein 2-like n=1 Tax=Centruroides sculpturatus TaxID=218467 RepID=UPI000C6D6998|nr:chloride channel protein 2-like [Centruroides sculpturatus]